LQDYAAIGIDTDRRIVYWNEGAERTFGYRETDVLGQPLAIIFTPEDIDTKAYDREFDRAISLGFSEDQRWQVRKDGSRVWVTGTLRALRNSRGELEGFSKIVRDTTVNKVAELQREALLKREESARVAAESSWRELEELVENVPALIALLRLPQQSYIFANRMLREYVGSQNLIGRNIREAHPALGDEYLRILDEVSMSGTSYVANEYQIPLRPGFERPDNPYFNLVLQPRRGESDRLETLLIFAADVTSLVRARQECKLAEELATEQAEILSEQAALLDLAQDAISAARLDGTITYWNRGAEELFGWSKPEALGKNINELLQTATPVPVKEIVDTVISKGQWSGDLRHTARNGRVVLDMSRWVLRKDGGPSGWLQIDRDVTELRRMQILLTERQKLESLGVLAGGVAHDFNNLLTGILGNISMARDMVAPGAKIQELLARSEEACERAADLVKQMLAYAGKGQFTPVAVDLSRVVRDIVPLLRGTIRDNIDFDLNLAEGLPSIQADPTQLRQVAMNLILNSVESIENSGAIRIRSRIEEVGPPEKEDRWDVGEPEPGTYVALEVQDTGCGVDPTVRAKIFEPFFTTKFAGRGLGLAAVAGIVRSLNGALRLESKPAEGTTATALFRCDPTRHTQSPGAQDPILIVDDDQTVLDTASAVLRNRGYEVLLASNGRQAVDILREREGRVSTVLLDVAMPVMNGPEAFRELKRLQPDLRVIILTGYRVQDAVRTFGGLGVAAFIEKPYTSRHLLEVVHRVLQ